MDFPCVDRSKIVELSRKTRRPVIAKKKRKRILYFGKPCIVFQSQSSPSAQKAQTNTQVLSLPSQIHTLCAVATQQAGLARWWKDQACRWTDRISRGAWLRENWGSLRLTLIVEGSPLQRIFTAAFLTWADMSECVRLMGKPTKCETLRNENIEAGSDFERIQQYSHFGRSVYRQNHRSCC